MKRSFSRLCCGLTLTIALLLSGNSVAFAQSIEENFFYREKPGLNQKNVSIIVDGLFEHPQRSEILRSVISDPNIIEIVRLDEKGLVQLIVSPSAGSDYIAQLFNQLGFSLLSDFLLKEKPDFPVPEISGTKAIQCCSQSTTVSGQDDGPTTANISMNCAPAGAVFTVVTLSANIGTYCPSWYTMTWNIGGTSYPNMCNGSNDYHDLDGTVINGTNFSVSSVDQDVYSDYVTINMTVTACWDDGIAPQQIITVLDGTNPAGTGGYTDICQGETVTFTAHGLYPDNGTTYTQSDATSTFSWDFGDGNTQSGVNLTTVSNTFANQGGYDINLTITDVQGATSGNDIGHRVRVSTTPDFTGTTVSDDVICLGACTDVIGVVNPTPWTQPTGGIVAGTTFLPDGSGVEYTTDLTFDEFNPGQTVTNASDIVEICLNMEHSYLGDLSLYIECPNGQTMDIITYGNNTGGGTIVGEPIAVGLPVDDVSTNTDPGVGYDYCFSSTSTNGMIYNSANWSTIGTYVDGNGNSSSSVSQANAGTYQVDGAWNDLLGCPLNGTWTIHLTDNIGSDNGYIFQWGINFNPSLYPVLWGFTPNIVSTAWTGPGLTGTTACPTTTGNSVYTYTATDDFGCSYNTTVNVTVTPGLNINTTTTNTSCYHSCDGTASLALLNGTANFNFYWENTSGTFTDQTINTPTSGNSVVGLCADDYTITVSDSEGCENIINLSITEPPQMTLNLTPTDENCGLGDGTISATVGGGSPLYDFASTPAVDNALNQGANYTFNGLGSGPYVVTVTDNNGCTVTGNTNVGNTGSVTAAFTYSGNQCYNVAGNTVTFTNTSVGASSYSWDFGDGSGTSTQTNPSYTFNGPGQYSVVLTASQGACSATATVTVTIYGLPILSLTPTNVTCSGFCDGQIVAVASAGPSGSSVFTSYSWSNGQSTSTVSSLCAGSYTVTVTDNVGCASTATAPITQPAAVSISPATVDLTCNAICNGEAYVVSVSGGTGPFSYIWNNGQTTQSITGLCAGTYTVTVSDNASVGCTNTETYSVGQPPAIILSTSSTNSTCSQPDGTATVNITNGSPDYLVQWSNGSTITTSLSSHSITNVPSGSYSVTVTDADGCSVITSVNVNDNAGPTSSITNSTNILCNGLCTGDMTVTVSGGTGPYTYNWDNTGAGAPTASLVQTAGSLCAGNHSVVITDATGCNTSASTTITEPSLVTVSATGSDQNCSALGSATAFPNGGSVSGAYGYSWSGGTPPLNMASVSGLSAGTYTVTVSDDNSCTATASVTIVDIGGMSATITANTPVSCNGGSNGSATVQVTGGTPNYTYTWISGSPVVSASNTNTVTGLSAQSYEVTISDANGCGASAAFTIAEPSAVNAAVSNITNASCNGISDGSLTVNAGGGTPGYTYLWSPNTGGQTTNPATGLADGTYTVTVSDLNGCTTTTTGTISEPSSVVVTSASSVEHCGQSNGSAWVVTAAGGNAGSYTYLWSGGAVPLNQDTVNGLSAGSYTVTVYDVFGCTGTSQVSVSNVPGGSASIASFQNVSCFGLANGQATVSCTGEFPFLYNWSNGQSTQTATGLSGGTYTVTVTDAFNCTATATVTISEPQVLTVSVSSAEPDCYGGANGSIGAIVSGGTTTYSYLWSNGNTSQSFNAGLGWYCVTVTDANQCSASACDSITQPDPIQITGVVLDANCSQPDGAVFLTSVGGTGVLQYAWSNGTTNDSLLNVPSGTYTITVTDEKSCTSTQIYTVNNNSGPTAVIDTSVNVPCNGGNTGSATVLVTGGQAPYTYLWSDGQTNPIATNLAAGGYVVSVTDLNHCQASVNVLITQPPVLGANLSSVNPSCYDSLNGYATVVPFGGTPPYDYQWSGGGVTPTESINYGLGQGTYSILVTDAHSCNILQNVTLTEPSQIIFAIASLPSTCANSGDGLAYVYNVSGGTPDVTNGYFYDWDNSAGGQATDTAYNLDAGNYCITLTDANSCSQTACVNVNAPSSVNIDSISVVDVACHGQTTGSVSVSVSGGMGGYTFLWVNNQGNTVGNSQSVSNLLAGSYCVSVADGNGCDDYLCDVVTQPPPLVVSIASDSLHCYGECDGQLTSGIVYPYVGQPPYTYVWSNFQQNDVATGLCGGMYTVTITDDNNCTASAYGYMYEPPLLEIVDVIVTDATCGNSDGCAQIVFNGGSVGYSFIWSFPSGNSVLECDLAAGNYGVTVQDIYGCTTETIVNVSNLDGPVIDNVVISDVTCAGYNNGSATITYSPSTPDAGPYTITWSDGQTGPAAYGLSGGNIVVEVTDTNLCLDSYTVFIGEPSQIQALVTNTNNVNCYGSCNGTAVVSALGGTPQYSYLWPSGGTSSLETGLCYGNHMVTVSDANGCTATALASIGQPAQLNLQATVHDADCYGANNGYISVIALGGSGAYNYYWPDAPWVANSSTAAYLAPGDYTLVLSDQNASGCFIDAVFTVAEPEPISVIVSTTPTHCDEPNGTATIESVTGGSGFFDYIWSPPNTSPTATGLTYGTNYLLQVVDAAALSSCYIDEYVVVGRTAPPSVLAQSMTMPSCFGYADGTAMVVIKDGKRPYQYSWDPVVAGDQDSVAYNLFGGLYNVVVTDADGCTTYTSFVINQPEPVMVYGAGSTTICNGQSTVISANASGGTFPWSYSWSGGITNTQQVQSVSPEQTTVYLITAEDANGCPSENTAAVQVLVRPKLEVYASIDDTLVCSGSEIDVSAFASGGNGDYMYFWSNGMEGNVISVTPLDSISTYAVTVYDANFCSAPDSSDTYVHVMPAPKLSMQADLLEGCEPLLVQFYNYIEQDNVVYEWSFGDASSGSQNYSYEQNPLHLFDSPGEYNISLSVTSTTYGCRSEFMIPQMISVYPDPVADFNMMPDVTSVFHSEVNFFDLSTNAVDWTWDFGDGYYNLVDQHPTHAYAYPDTFTIVLEVRTEHYCWDTTSHQVIVHPEHTFYMPTAFSPRPTASSSEENAFCTPEASGLKECDNCYEFIVYDRWGEIIYYTDKYYGHTLNEEDRWNGRFMNTGRMVQLGVYTVYVRYTDILDYGHEHSGSVTVIR